MADITKCKGTGCPIKKECYRFIEIPSDMQSWFFNPPFQIVNNHVKCNRFWKITHAPTKQIIRDDV